MRHALFVTVLGLTTTLAVPAAGQAPLGIFFRWAAFEQASPRKCYAIAAAVSPSARGEDRAYASVAALPKGAGPQPYLRLSRSKREGSAVILRVDGRAFQLIGGGRDAWAPNARADAAIVAAMRTGVNMAVESRSDTGGRIRDRYVLRGAASAIDAAAFACASEHRGGARKKPQ